ncbi:MAG: NAD(P)-dependent oxidoreductase [Tannerellaceae bacterium]|jgi:nucleoside-diphosphate-sugar epimerase|nr:NAD(P)-dependent oxidoreductase [Tannerellaceae bacterium]
MRVLITGASGFIGAYLVEEGLRRGYEVWVAVRSTSDLSRLPKGNIHILVDLPFDKVNQLTERLATIPKDWDYVLHNAGATKVVDKEDFLRINALYTKNFTEALVAAGRSPKKFLLMSSLSSYGRSDEKTFRPICISDPQHPESLYGQSKLAAERYVALAPFPYVILHPTGVYGPGDKDYALALQKVRKGIGFAVGIKSQKLTFIYVKDLARIAFLALENNKALNKRYLVADGDTYTDRTFTHLMQQAVGRRFLISLRIPLPLVRLACLCSEQFGRLRNQPMTLNSDKYLILRQRNWVCDTTLLRDELGFVPEYPLEKGLAEIVTHSQ